MFHIQPHTTHIHKNPPLFSLYNESISLLFSLKTILFFLFFPLLLSHIGEVGRQEVRVLARITADLPVALIEGAVGGERVADLEVSLCEGSVCVVRVRRASNRMKNEEYEGRTIPW